MAGFLVDSRTLLIVRDTLGRLHDQLLSIHTTVYGYWGTLGGSALEGELEHFCGTWHYGVTELSAQIQDLMVRLTEAAAAYERMEQRVTHAGSGSGTTVIGGPSGSSGSGSGTTVIGGPSGTPSGGAPARSGSGSGTVTIG